MKGAVVGLEVGMDLSVMRGGRAVVSWEGWYGSVVSQTSRGCCWSVKMGLLSVGQAGTVVGQLRWDGAIVKCGGAVVNWGKMGLPLFGAGLGCHWLVGVEWGCCWLGLSLNVVGMSLVGAGWGHCYSGQDRAVVG